MMSGASTAFADIDQNVGINVRYFREQAGLTQEELAQRMIDRGFGFTQTTIWKVESGQRPVKVSELVALSNALDARSWTMLVQEPETGRRFAQLQLANRRAHDAYEALTVAAASYLEEQLNVLFAVREAHDEGIDTERWRSWLEMPAERAVIEARLDMEHGEELLQQRESRITAAMTALIDAGYRPWRPEDVQLEDGEVAGEQPSHETGSPADARP